MVNYKEADVLDSENWISKFIAVVFILNYTIFVPII